MSIEQALNIMYTLITLSNVVVLTILLRRIKQYEVLFASKSLYKHAKHAKQINTLETSHPSSDETSTPSKRDFSAYDKRIQDMKSLIEKTQPYEHISTIPTLDSNVYNIEHAAVEIDDLLYPAIEDSGESIDSIVEYTE